VEEFYATHGELTCFQITPGVCPPGLDPWLAACGYTKHAPISLQVASTVHVLDRVANASVEVEVEDRPAPAWFDTWYSIHGQGSDPRREWELLARVEPLSGYASAVIGERVVGVGRVVAESGWAGMFGMATLPEARGKGVARSVLAALARWAHAVDVDQLYLQVERDNISALGLYRQAGFTEVCGYHYRSAGQPENTPISKRFP
jgi:ribosomal protein S18 acetylase RimI-like enzyme